MLVGHVAAPRPTSALRPEDDADRLAVPQDDPSVTGFCALASPSGHAKNVTGTFGAAQADMERPQARLHWGLKSRLSNRRSASPSLLGVALDNGFNLVSILVNISQSVDLIPVLNLIGIEDSDTLYVLCVKV